MISKGIDDALWCTECSETPAARSVLIANALGIYSFQITSASRVALSQADETRPGQPAFYWTGVSRTKENKEIDLMRFPRASHHVAGPQVEH